MGARSKMWIYHEGINTFPIPEENKLLHYLQTKIQTLIGLNMIFVNRKAIAFPWLISICHLKISLGFFTHLKFFTDFQLIYTTYRFKANAY